MGTRPTADIQGRKRKQQVSGGITTILKFLVYLWNSIHFSSKQMILMLLLNTPYLSNMIMWLSSAFNDKDCVMPLRALFHNTVFPLIFRSPLGTDIIFVCLSPFMHPWILSKFISVSYLWSISYLFRVYLPPNSHLACKCMIMRSQAWAISFNFFLQNLPLFISLHQHKGRSDAAVQAPGDL